MESSFTMEKSTRQEEEFLHQQIDLKCQEERSKVLNWGIDGYGAENWKLRKIDQNNRKSFEMWY